ncbi:substrate-binding periplasmic protein [Spartinivicinus poritis]|uniref:Transporter substrate-binding domain-containing protein n=1 Tax=Spartinivicinus poritis TaxID=2994640 RepID=A0ABT5UAS1_9GAMM|nr:transporter substrate-binding domain-containing protein [Spartinivicinus sp. A2-2]MDE1463458.1 transporter substrate-binding domain-containing protein [Spartinivicinus sp. A2-2]
MKVLIITALFYFTLASRLASCDLTVTHVSKYSDTDNRDLYYIELLNLVLNKTKATDGDFTVKMAESPLSQDRAIASLQENKFINVLWTMTSRRREELLLPIRIPLLKGLLGHRIFIIKEADKAKFESIKSLKALKQYRAGQGHDWPDTTILKANGIPTVTSPDYEGLFAMLKHGRFDYFPRGVTEIWGEVASHHQERFIVNQTLMLVYPAPFYFFVNKANTALADRLERGLWIAIKDGSFDKLFYNHPAHAEVFKSAKMENRIIFNFINPLLPSETPLDNQVLWHKVN